jgi:hypothetical protein
MQIVPVFFCLGLFFILKKIMTICFGFHGGSRAMMMRLNARGGSATLLLTIITNRRATKKLTTWGVLPWKYYLKVMMQRHVCLRAHFP